jgi:putative transcriptional regulator
MFRNRIAYWANERGFKYKALAKQCGVSVQTFSSWVNNKTQPDLKHSFMLARILGIPVDELGELEDEKSV